MRICSSGLQNDLCEPFSDMAPPISKLMLPITTCCPVSRSRLEALKAVLHVLLRSRAERYHRNHRAHPNDDAQHGEQRAELVGPQRLERDFDDLAQEHRFLGAPRLSTSTVSFSARPAVTSM